MINGFIGRQVQKSGAGAAIALSHGSKVSIGDCEALEGTGTFLSLNDLLPHGKMTPRGAAG